MDFTVDGGTAEDCETWGFKCANTAQRGRINNTISRRCGIGGFVASGPFEPSTTPTMDVTFDGCTAEDVLGNYKKAGSFGFGILKQKADPTYPRNVTFRSCVARAVSSRMDYGYRNDVPAALTEGMPNRLVDCQATGYATAFQHGFNET